MLLIVFAIGAVILMTQTIYIPGLGNLHLGPSSVITGSGNVVSETREVSGVDSAVVFKAPGEMTITLGETPALTIEADDNLMGIIQTRVENGTLVIELTAGPNVSLQLNQPIRYRLTVTSLESIELAGAGSIQALGIEAEDLKVNFSGGGKIELTGHAGSQEVKFNGAGIYQAGDLESQNVTLSASGSVDATVWATDRLDVDCKGACSVKYYGDPALGKNINAVGLVISLGTK